MLIIIQITVQQFCVLSKIRHLLLSLSLSGQQHFSQTVDEIHACLEKGERERERNDEGWIFTCKYPCAPLAKGR